MNEDDRMKAFEERIEKRKKLQKVTDENKAEQLRQDYLKRTGRTALKP